jgi:RNase adaptor protein for sRNA GlmZ degradation
MGAYGLRGWIEGKPLFIQSIGYAVKNLSGLIEENRKGLMIYPELSRVLTAITGNSKFRDAEEPGSGELVVRIYSFSYFRGIPDDISGHGGGYVFDCRHILNPGKFSEFSHLTGLDSETAKFFVEKTDMGAFLMNVFSIIDQTIKTYIERDFRHLQVSFGCTGGRHRSVYAAQRLYDYLRHKGIRAIVEHLELKDLIFN